MRRHIVIGAILVAAGAAALSCGLSQPSVENDKFKTPAFDHTGVTSGCAQCHESSRPPAPHPQGTDCSSCHAYPKWAELTTPFTHEPTPESCAQCHEKVRPSRADHPQEGDCVSCHSYPRWKATK